MRTLAVLMLAVVLGGMPIIARAGPILVTGPGEGGGPHVRVFDATTGQEIFSFFVFPLGFTGGVRVAASDVNGDGVADLVVAAGPGGGPHVRVFDGAALVAGQLVELMGFFAYAANFTGGVYIAAAAAGGGGDITGVSAGAGLTGGGLSGTVTLGVATGGITSAMIANGAVGTVDLANNAVTAAKLAADAVDSTKILDGSISAADVNSGQIQLRVADSCAAGSSIRVINADGTVACQTDTNSGGTITGVTAGAGLTGGGTSGPVTLTVATGGITSGMIANGAVGTVDLANSAVTAAKLAADAVDSSKILDGSVGTADLADGAVTTAKLATNAVTSTKIAPGVITPSHIAPGSVPAASGFAFNSTTITGDGAFVVLPLPFERFDTQAMHDTVTNNERIVAPIAGIYLVCAQVSWSGGTVTVSASHYMQVHALGPLLDDFPVSERVPQIQDVSRGNLQAACNVVQLQAGDHVQLEAAHNVANPQGASGTLSLVWMAPL